MKRARSLPADYDPVYPYRPIDTTPSTQPPFINSQKGLTQSPPGRLAVSIDPPLVFNNDGAIDVATGPGLNIKKGRLQVNLGPGLGTDESGQVVLLNASKPLTFAAPLSLSNSTVMLQVGQGLAIQGNNLINTNPTPLTATAPLRLTNNTMSLQIADGLRALNNKLAPALGSGLAINSGLICVKLAAGLSFNEQGAIQFTAPPSSVSLTLWTGPDPSVNGYISDRPLIKCFVCLTRINSMVMATAYFQGVGEYETVHSNHSPFSLSMEFDSSGHLLSTGNIRPAGGWGEKPWATNQVIPTYNPTWKLCMPNREVYHTNAGHVFWQELGLDTFALDNPTSRHIDFIINLNQNTHHANAAYNLSFRFLNFNKLSGGTLFKTDTVSFSYVGENQ